MVAAEVLRPISRKYDLAEHEYPKELDMLAALIDGMDEGAGVGAGAAGAGQAVSRASEERTTAATRTASNLASVLTIIEMCWGDVGLLLSMPRQGLGNSAIAAVANDEQKERFEGKWAAMAITEPEAGSDSAAIRTTAVLDGDDYVLNGEKIYVTAGERADLVVVWASLDPEQGRAAIKSFVVERSNPGLKLDRLEHKLGIRASDTAAFILDDCRVPKENLLGDPEIDTKKSFAGVDADVRQHPPAGRRDGGRRRQGLDSTRRASCSTRPASTVDYDSRRASRAPPPPSCIETRGRLRGGPPADHGGRLDGRQRQAELAAGLLREGEGRPDRHRHRAALRRAGRRRRLLGEDELLEKWARDAKILDIFEGTQQIQLLIIARQLLGLTSAELK